MVQIEKHIKIQSPAGLVFQALQEPELLKQWLSGFVSSTVISGGENQIGSKALVVIEERGKHQEMTSTLLEHEQDRKLVVDVSNDMIQSKSAYTLMPADGGTELVHGMAFAMRGIMRPFGFLFKSMVAKKMENDLAALKQLLEGQV